MHCGRVLTGALAAAVYGLSSTPSLSEIPDRGREVCATVTKDLKGQIEEIKQLKAGSKNSLQSFAKKGKTAKADSPMALVRRAREQANALNEMLPGLGCERIDIDYELTKPLNRALVPASPKTSKMHRKP